MEKTFFDWSLAYPCETEINISDRAAKQTALDAFRADVNELGYHLANARVSRKDDYKIVRIDIVDHDSKKIVGLAIRVERNGEIYDAISI